MYISTRATSSPILVGCVPIHTSAVAWFVRPGLFVGALLIPSGHDFSRATSNRQRFPHLTRCLTRAFLLGCRSRRSANLRRKYQDRISTDRNAPSTLLA